MLRGFGPPPGVLRLHAPAGLQPRRLPARRQPATGRLPEPLGPRARVGARGRARGRRPRGLAAPQPCPGRAGRRRGRRGRLRAGPRNQGGDASPWIEHAVWLYRRGDSPGAADALARAMEALPDDPGCWVDLGRSARRLGWAEGSETALAKARSLLERRLARAPDDEAAAAALAELLPDADAFPGLDHPPARSDDLRRGRHADPAARRLGPGRWPESRRRHLHGRGRRPACPGSPDCGSRPSPTRACRASGPDGFTQRQLRPGRDPLVRGPRAGGRGPGPPDPGRPSTSIPPGESRDVERGRSTRTRSTVWSILPTGGPSPMGRLPDRPTDRARRRHEVAGRAGLSGQRVPDSDPGPVPPVGHRTGRSRYHRTESCGGSRPTRDGSGLTRLGAAYGLLGDWASAAAVLGRAAARPDASALDGFLLALARHHLGRARRGPERLRSRPRVAEDRSGRRRDPRRGRRGADDHPGPGRRRGRVAPARCRVPRRPVRVSGSGPSDPMGVIRGRVR